MERLTVAEAAKRLGVTPEAVRQRIRRDTIEHEKGEDGRTYVFLDPDITASEGVHNPLRDELLKEYKDRIHFLETELNTRTRFLQDELESRREELRRKDHLLAALTERIPAIEAPKEEPAEPRESAVSDSKTEAKGDVPEEPAEAKIRQSWWQRWFGG